MMPWFRTLVALAAAVVALSISSASAQTKTFITIGSGSTTGLYYPTAVGIAKIINEANVDIRVNARSTGGSVYNAKAIGQGQIQIALLQNNIAHYAYAGDGIEAFRNQPVKSLRAIAALYPEVIHLLARIDAGIDSPAHLRAKRVYVGDVGSGTELDAKNILSAYGTALSALRSAIRGTASAAVSLLRDNRIDAMFYTVGVGSAAITEATQTAPIKVVPLDEDKVMALHQEHPFYTPFTILANTYPGMVEDIRTITMMAMLAVDEAVPEDIVYRFMKVLFEEQLQAFYSDIQNPNLKKYFNVETALEGVPIPLHPGAIRFFRESGIEIPSRLASTERGG